MTERATRSAKGTMSEPVAFSWIDNPRLAALGRPEGPEALRWLRRQGIDVLISLTEDPPPRRGIDDAGLMLVHVPVPDMTAPTPEDLDTCLAAIDKAHRHGLGVAVHCEAGQGRTGVIIACFFVSQGMPAADAIRKVRRLRPGSIETKDQETAVREFADRLRPGA
jgi:atypical dual specificity phosphatase